MKRIITFFILGILFPGKVYIGLQMLDQVGIVDLGTLQLEQTVNTDFNEVTCMDYTDEMSCDMVNGCEWMMNMCMESGGGMQMSNNTPHFVAIDEMNGYWFVTTIASGYIAQFKLITNELIDQIFVGDAPALLALNKNDKKLYCSRMMPMGNMMPGTESTIIHEIDYSGDMLVTLNEFEIPSPSPHGISINSDGSEVYVASNTADWIYKIIPSTGEITGSVMDMEINNPSDIETQRLKPIQCLSMSDTLLFITCSGGQWIDPWTGTLEEIPGEIQLWNTNTMTQLSSYQFEWYSSPWHIINNPIRNQIHIALGGDGLYPGSSGVATLTYVDSQFNLDWFTPSEEFETLHGITVSDDGNYIYASGRGDGHLHVLNSADGLLIDSIELSPSEDMVMPGGVAFFEEYQLGNLNNDQLIDIFDIILLVSYILDSLDDYNEVLFEFSGDLNFDTTVDILDIFVLISIILNS